MTKTKKIVVIAIFAAISSVLMYLEFRLPIFPGFLEIDLSNIPALIATFMFGPIVGVLITFIKDIIHLPVSETLFTGELADFIISTAFILTAYFIYKAVKGKKGAIIGCVGAIFTAALTGGLINKFFMIWFYISVMHYPLETIIDMSRKAMPFFPIKDINTIVLYVIVPFNLLKGTLVSLVTILVYKKLELFIKKNSIVSK